MKTSVGVSYAVMLRKNQRGEFGEHPFSQRTIPSQASEKSVEGVETRKSNLRLFSYDGIPKSALPSSFRGEDLVQTRMQILGLKDKEPLATLCI
jgi:hypothetical protein